MELALTVLGLIGGMAASLAGVTLTHWLAGRADRRRRADEDRTRWLTERRRVGAQLLGGALILERQLWSACAVLDRGERRERIPGHKSVLLTPEAGVPPVIDQVTRAILVEAVEEALRRLDDLEVLATELAVIGSPDEGEAAGELLESLAYVVGLLEAFSPFDEAANAIDSVRSSRDRLLKAMRSSLMVEGRAVSADSRPA